MLWKLVVIFVAGVVIDLMITKYTRSVASNRPKTAAALSGIITLANIGVWGTIIHEAETLGVWGAIAMAVGASIGTLLGFKTKIQLSPSPASISISSAPMSSAPTSSASTSSMTSASAATTPASRSPVTITGLISP